MGKTTDGLIRLAHEVTPTPPEREVDMLLATGEQVSIALLAMAIHALGHKARSFTGEQAGIRTDAAHTRRPHRRDRRRQGPARARRRLCRRSSRASRA
jgi:aspartate kinase